MDGYLAVTSTGAFIGNADLLSSVSVSPCNSTSTFSGSNVSPPSWSIVILCSVPLPWTFASSCSSPPKFPSASTQLSVAGITTTPTRMITLSISDCPRPRSRRSRRLTVPRPVSPIRSGRLDRTSLLWFRTKAHQFCAGPVCGPRRTTRPPIPAVVRSHKRAHSSLAGVREHRITGWKRRVYTSG